jgi:hypothetical protein
MDNLVAAKQQLIARLRAGAAAVLQLQADLKTAYRVRVEMYTRITLSHVGNMIIFYICSVV